MIFSLLALHAGVPHAPEFCVAVRTVRRIRFPLYLLLCTVFLLNADVPRCRWALPQSGEAFLLSFLSLSLKLVCCRLEICNILPGDCASVCSRSASLHLATELLSARGRASVCSGPCCASSSGSCVLLMARVESLQCSAQL